MESPAPPLGLLAFSLLACGDSPDEARVKLARMQLKYDADTLVKLAVQGDVVAVRLFLAAGMSPNIRDKDGLRPLVAAAYAGPRGVVELLLQHGAVVNVREAKFGGTPLIHAAWHGHLAVVRMLLDHGADPEAADTKEGRTALLWAVR